MKIKEIIESVKDGTAEYKINDISKSDVINTKVFIEGEKLTVVDELGVYEEILHEQVTQGIQWYHETQDIGYLDLSRNILFELIGTYLNEGYLK